MSHDDLQLSVAQREY